MDVRSVEAVVLNGAAAGAIVPAMAGLSELADPVALVDDPRAWRLFAHEVVTKHHRVHRPGIQADQCSCGRPLMLCSIALLAERLVHRKPK